MTFLTLQNQYLWLERVARLTPSEEMAISLSDTPHHRYLSQLTHTKSIALFYDETPFTEGFDVWIEVHEFIIPLKKKMDLAIISTLFGYHPDGRLTHDEERATLFKSREELLLESILMLPIGPRGFLTTQCIYHRVYKY